MKGTLLQSAIIAVASILRPFAVSALKPYTPELSATYSVNADLQGEMNVTVTAPKSVSVTTGSGWWSYETEGEALPEGTVMTITLTRSCSSLGESRIPILNLENVVPSQVIELTDNESANPLQSGYTYTYYCTASITEGETTEESTEVYASKLFGLTIDMSSQCGMTEEADGSVTLKYTVPATYDGGEALPVPVTSLELYALVGYDSKPAAGATPLQTIENPVAGAEVVFSNVEHTDNALNNWYVLAKCDLGTGGVKIQKWVGLDIPSSVTSVTGTAMGKGVVISWNAPTYGQNSYLGAFFDPELTRYKVYRTFGYSADPQLIADDLAETTFTDTAEDMEAPKKVNYKVVAYNVAGEASAVFANGSYTNDLLFVAGPYYTLPFVENISADKTSDKCWTLTTPSGGVKWEFQKPFKVGNSYNPTASVEGVDGAGVAGVNYSNPYDYSSKRDIRSSLNSHGIDLAKARKPVLRFSYYAIPACETKFEVIAVTDNGSDILKSIAISEDTDLDTFGWTAENWREVEIDLSAFAGVADFRLAFSSWYEASKNALMISGISIVDESPAPMSFIVDDIEYTPVEETALADEEGGETHNPEVVATRYLGSGENVTVPSVVANDDVQYNVAAVGESAFSGNENVKEVTIQTPAIHDAAFADCSNLAKVMMHRTTAAIGARAFGGCSSLKRVEFDAIEVPEVAADAFEGIHKDCTGRCPEESFTAYNTHSALSGIAFDKPAGIDTILSAASEVDVYTIDGRKVLDKAAPSALHGLAPGVYLIAADGKVVKKVIR